MLPRVRMPWSSFASPALALTTIVGVSPTTHARAPRPVATEASAPGCRKLDALCCAPDEAPCVRPGAARALLMSLGAAAGATAAGILFALGDRLSNGDAGTVLVGAGALAGSGALLGIVAGRLLGDAPSLRDRVRRETLGLSLTGTGTRVLGEARPPTMALRFGPAWWFDERTRLRLVGEVAGLLGAERDVDPRPQLADGSTAGPGTQPGALSRRRMAMTLGLDLAVGLPYPAIRRSAHLGRAELRWRPEVQWRREWIDLGDSGTRSVERTMLLPLLVGARWHTSPRQRFTFYVGPRFDIVSYSALDGRAIDRGRPNLGPLYAEAWYDIDIGLTERPRRDGRPRRALATSMLTVGYVHSRFTGRGFNFGPVIGFLGPIVAEYTVRVRPRGAKTAIQLGAATMIGNGVSVTGTVGAVLPDLGRAASPRRQR